MGCGSLSTLRVSRRPPVPAPVPDTGPRYAIPLPPSAKIPTFPVLEGYQDFGSEVALEENAWRPYYERQASAMTPLRYSMHGSDLSAAKTNEKGKEREEMETPTTTVEEVAGEKREGSGGVI